MWFGRWTTRAEAVGIVLLILGVIERVRVFRRRQHQPASCDPLAIRHYVHRCQHPAHAISCRLFCIATFPACDRSPPMDQLTQIILQAGRSAVELSLFVLLPIMVVMLSLMRLLEARGVLDWVVARLAPLLRPAGLTGLGVFAALQINLVSFAAPMATLTMMESRGASDRHLAATLAMVMAMAQANVTFPMAAMGLAFGPALLLSIIGGVVAAAATYHVSGRGPASVDAAVDQTMHHPVGRHG